MKINIRKNYIMLGWANSIHKTKKNFGDELSPYIVKKLTGKDVYHFDSIPRWRIPFSILKSIIYGKFNSLKAYSMVLQLINYNYYLCVGSILQFYNLKGAIVWGSGIINKTDYIQNFKFSAVRGKFTRDKLVSQGYDVPEIYGDPGILLPIIYEAKKIKKFKIGLIPHIIHYDMFNSIKLNSNYLLINLQTNEIEKVIDEINSCDLIISSSLHGIIVSHSYNIKSLHFEFKGVKLMGDGVKFLDYFSSVGIEYYDPIELNYNELSNPAIIQEIFLKYSDFCLPQIEIANIQKKLLQSAPFSLLNKYNNLKN